MKQKILEIESPWADQPGRVRVARRPDEPDADALLRRPDGQGMVRPYIFETATERRLHFTQEATQTTLSLLWPDALIAAYTRKMMSFLLMNPDPRHIVLLGLGGGSLARFCHRHLPDSRITVVEIDPDVIALRDEFLIPRDGPRFRVVQDDGARYLAGMQEPIDALLIDAFDEEGIAASMGNRDFHAAAARMLTDRGVLVMNLWGKPDRFAANVEAAAAQFGPNAVLVTVLGEYNVLLFASKQPPPKSITEDLEATAARLQKTLKLDFPRYLRRICQGEALVPE
jgi:spermidine synthase